MGKRVVKYEAGFTLKFNEGINGADYHRFAYGIEEELDEKENYEKAFNRIRNEVRQRCLEDKADLHGS